MIPVWAFPALLIVIDVMAALVYVFDGDWRRAVYWLAAAVLTTTVTF
jgi:hypothetical protein